MAAPVPISINTSGAVSQQMPVTYTSFETRDVTDGAGGPKRVFKFRQQFEKETVSANQSQERIASPPPPPPPMQFADTPRMAPAPPAPPPPPPPPEIPHLFDKDKGTFTFRDKKGRARTVRIGRVVWPPPQEQDDKPKRDVGRLEIDEKVKSDLSERMRPVVQQKKPTPREEKKVTA